MAVTAVLERGVGTRNCEGDAQRATTKSEPPSASVYDFVGEKCSRDVIITTASAALERKPLDEQIRLASHDHLNRATEIETPSV
jgi:hypothetical protein